MWRVARAVLNVGTASIIAQVGRYQQAMHIVTAVAPRLGVCKAGPVAKALGRESLVLHAMQAAVAARHLAWVTVATVGDR